MSSVPLLSDAQWRLIEDILPENRRDRTVITAILYLEHSGQPLRHVGEQYGLSQTRLHEWHHAIEADGSLTRLMAALKLEPASALDRGDQPFHSHNAAMVAQVTALRLRLFGDALHSGSKRSESALSQSAATTRPTPSSLRRWCRRAWRHVRRVYFRGPTHEFQTDRIRRAMAQDRAAPAGEPARPGANHSDPVS